MAGYVGQTYHQRPSDILEIKGSVIRRLLVDNYIFLAVQEETRLPEPGSSSLKDEIYAKRRQWEREAREKYGR